MSLPADFLETSIDFKSEFEREKADLESTITSSAGLLPAAAARLQELNDALDLIDHGGAAPCRVAIVCRIPPSLKKDVMETCWGPNFGIDISSVDPAKPEGTFSCQKFLTLYKAQLKDEIKAPGITAADKAAKKRELKKVNAYQKFFLTYGDVRVWQEHAGVVDPKRFISHYCYDMEPVLSDELSFRRVKKVLKIGGLAALLTAAAAVGGGAVRKGFKEQKARIEAQEKTNRPLNALVRSVVLTEVIRSIDAREILSAREMRSLIAKGNRRTGSEDIYLAALESASAEHTKIRQKIEAQKKFPKSQSQLREDILERLGKERDDARTFHTLRSAVGDKGSFENYSGFLVAQYKNELHKQNWRMPEEERMRQAEIYALQKAGEYNSEERAIFLGPNGLSAVKKMHKQGLEKDQFLNAPPYDREDR